ATAEEPPRNGPQQDRRRARRGWRSRGLCRLRRKGYRALAPADSGSRSRDRAQHEHGREAGPDGRGGSVSRQTAIPLQFEGEDLESVFVGRRDGQPRPTVMMIPTVMGVSDLEIGFGRQLVELGYNAFVADPFGKKFHGAARDVCFGEMRRLASDRQALLRRTTALLDQVRGLDEVDGGKVVVSGYCFGGMCALDIARSGAHIAAACSFHG